MSDIVSQMRNARTLELFADYDGDLLCNECGAIIARQSYYNSKNGTVFTITSFEEAVREHIVSRHQ